ncbi:DEAD-box ATP-dependent RNA helicase CshB [Companilactobacillus sp. RD055328]|nr:DEAD-box ATP-dependent RNA helicase CshB [Companilactobacillus sp. RD055328]
MGTTFKSMGFKEFINKSLTEINFSEATPVQEKVIPLVRKGHDLIVQSQTGSGKTHAYLLPIMDRLEHSDSNQVVITSPSRELAYQIYDDTEEIAKNDNITVSNFVGGTDKKRQENKLDNSQPEIAVGTPGRLLDLIKTNHLKVSDTKVLVIDEADMTLDMGFLDDVNEIASSMGDDLQILVFSATIPEKLQPFLKKYLTQPKFVVIDNPNVVSENVENWLISSRGQNKHEMIYDLLTIGQPFLSLIFANSRTEVDAIYEFLLQKGLKVTRIHGGLTPRERKRTMKRIENMEFQFVVATDLASRGIDITGVSHVINAEIPDDLEFFIHRSGRTGRNKLSGIAITLFDPRDEEKIGQLEHMGIKFNPKEIKHHDEVVDTYERNRRQNRNASKEKLSTSMRGLVKKEKKKRKPGYKKKIQSAIKDEKRKNKKIEARQEQRELRKKRKSDNAY